MSKLIYYLEQSGLLSRSLTEEAPQWEWKVFHEEEDFLNRLFASPPSLIIIGETGTGNIFELVFFIKSMKWFNTIPLLLYGEIEYSSLLPVNAVLSQDPDGRDRRASLIGSLLNTPARGKEKRNIPTGRVPARGKRREIFTRVICDEIYKKNCLNSLTTIDITGQSFRAIMETLGDRLRAIMDCPFVFIACPFNGDLQFHLSPSEADRGKEKELLNRMIRSYRDGIRVKNVGYFTFRNMGDGLIAYPPGKAGIPETLLRLLHLRTEELLARAIGLYKNLDETQIVYRSFTHFLPAAIIDDLLLKESEKALMTGEKRRVTALFSHIRDFDYIMEHNEPQQVVDFLNSHFTNMVAIIQWYGGIIDKFIGDAIFAIFGAPISYTDNTHRAAQAARDMIENFHEIDLSGLNLPPRGFSIGIGINEGEAIIGNIGCSDKFDYTAIGDTVNLAARLESLTKHYQQSILVSRSVYESIGKEMYCRLVDKAKVKGKNESTEIFSLETDPDSFREEWKDTYRKGLKMYSLGNWFTANQYFIQALELLPDDRVIQILRERCLRFMDNPPEEWDGAVTLDFK